MVRLVGWVVSEKVWVGNYRDAASVDGISRHRWHMSRGMYLRRLIGGILALYSLGIKVLLRASRTPRADVLLVTVLRFRSVREERPPPGTREEQHLTRR